MLKTEVEQKTAEQPKVEVKPQEETVLLVLNIYTQYNWQGKLFTKGTPYRFTKKDAFQLLSEMDRGTPIWRKHVPAKPKHDKSKDVVDATKVEFVPPNEENSLTPEVVKTKTKIEIGSDEEIADLLPHGDGSEDEVTV